ncbi:MAG TPA: LysM peptidoglycan-binding domain-containing protein [Anaerolineae bacterium]|nr:LysM peptidoglycan-binding domain-containing protein [Anaerolineae bacterium]
MKRLAVFIMMLLVLLNITAPVGAASRVAYTVQPGDTLFSVARRYGISVEALATANGLPTTAWLYVGQPLVIPGTDTTTPVTTPGTDPQTYIVKPGDTLTTIAIRYRVTANALAFANGLTWHSWVYVGQRLLIPGGAPSAAPTPTPATDGPHIVQPGDNLFRIALKYGVTVAALRNANGLLSDTIYIGQALKIPGQGVTPPPSQPPVNPTTGEKWIDVNLTTQTVTAYVGQTPVYSTLASTGLWGTPTVVGTYSIYAKYVSAPMSGPGYYLPNVPHIMYLYCGT